MCRSARSGTVMISHSRAEGQPAHAIERAPRPIQCVSDVLSTARRGYQIVDCSLTTDRFCAELHEVAAW
jgi:hypothetical protein